MPSSNKSSYHTEPSPTTDNIDDSGADREIQTQIAQISANLNSMNIHSPGSDSDKDLDMHTPEELSTAVAALKRLSRHPDTTIGQFLEKQLVVKIFCDNAKDIP